MSLLSRFFCHSLTQSALFRVVWGIGLLFLTTLYPTVSFSQNLVFDHITYLTGNLDSLVQSFTRQGFTVTPHRNLIDDVESYRIWLPDTTYVELESTNSRDTADWRVKAIQTYGTHISNLSLKTNLLDSFYTMFKELSYTGEWKQWEEGRGFAFLGPGPMELALVEYNSKHYKQLEGIWQRTQPAVLKDSIVHLPPYRHPNGAHKIHWLLLTASPTHETFLREVYRLLDLRQRNETYWDHWLIGPPDRRHITRFEIFPPTFTEDRLSIENNGVIYAIDP